MNKLFKTIPIILITLLSSVKLSSAQTFAIGPKVGLNASNFRGDDINREKFRKGLQAGLFFTYAPVEWFTVQPEILFDQRGAQETIFNETTREININYLTVPVTLNFRIPISETFYPKFLFGPYTAFALNESQNLLNSNTEPVFTETDVARADFGGIVGTGIDFQHNRLFASFEIRYIFGSVDVATEDEIEFRNTGVSTSAGIGIKF